MIHYVSEEINSHFQRNLTDWYRGGPLNSGWTRTGSLIQNQIFAKLLNCSFQMVSISDALAKNQKEIEKWHLSFLRGEGELYFKEYLSLRYSLNDQLKRPQSFLELLESIQENGIRKPVWLAETPWLDFKFFRFDGSHRICCAKFIGLTEVPALVFKTEILRKNN